MPNPISDPIASLTPTAQRHIITCAKNAQKHATKLNLKLAQKAEKLAEKLAEKIAKKAIIASERFKLRGKTHAEKYQFYTEKYDDAAVQRGYNIRAKAEATAALAALRKLRSDAHKARVFIRNEKKRANASSLAQRIRLTIAHALNTLR